MSGVDNRMASRAWRRAPGVLRRPAPSLLAQLSPAPFPDLLKSCSDGTVGSKGPLWSWGCRSGAPPPSASLQPPAHTYQLALRTVLWSALVSQRYWSSQNKRSWAFDPLYGLGF